LDIDDDSEADTESSHLIFPGILAQVPRSSDYARYTSEVWDKLRALGDGRAFLVTKEHQTFLFEHTNEHILSYIDGCIAGVLVDAYEGTGPIDRARFRQALPIETVLGGIYHVSAVPEDPALHEMKGRIEA
jgi:hypothetical protein